MFEWTEEQLAVSSSMRHFAQHELRWRARRLDSAPPGSIDWDFLRKSCDFGLLSAQLPPHYEGTMDRLSVALALEELARWEAGVTTLLASHSLALLAVTLSGHTALMERVFPDVLAAEARHEPLLWAIALSERRTGSDFQHPVGVPEGRMMVTARRRDAGYVLSGRKAYCAGGNVASWLTVFATVNEDRRLDGLTGFVLPTSTPGFHVSDILPTLGLRACPLVEFYLENVYVSDEQRLTPEGGGAALLQALSPYERGYAAAIALGIARGAFELARQHTLIRVQGGHPLIQHQMIQAMLADMATQIEAARLLTHKAATRHPPDLTVSSMAKVFASDTAVKVATDAVQIMGAYGTTGKSGAEKYFRDAKMMQIIAGTNELCRLAITAPLLPYAGQGMIGSD